ncbi:uncharacterized protein LOC127281618 [Leptopilina boulardi]|uniref:uncharacterized protein LOC127281618 n=1 Tax=Leptopilina boulardi TaxID=63433 RepID=UPI0021F5FC2D|nr:uncharacterized protein LOC127281618 [Leptopilina boulardi]
MELSLVEINDYVEKMHNLMLLEQPRITWGTILSMPIGQVVTTLLQHQCCISGSAQVLRERLFRISLRIDFANQFEVPFSELFDLGQSQEIFRVEAFTFPTDEERQNINLNRGGGQNFDSEEEAGRGSPRDLGILGMDRSRGNSASHSRHSPTNDNLPPPITPPPPPPVMTSACIMTNSVITTMSQSFSTTTCAIMTALQTIVSSTMAPSVLSLRESVARFSLSPEMRKLILLNQRFAELSTGFDLGGVIDSGVTHQMPIQSTPQNQQNEVSHTPLQRETDERNNSHHPTPNVGTIENFKCPISKQERISRLATDGSEKSTDVGEESRFDKRSGGREQRPYRDSDRARSSRNTKKTNARRTLFDETSSDTESESSDALPTRRDFREAERRSKVTKILKDWDIKFSGTEREDPEEFLERMEDCRLGELFNDEELLQAIPSIFRENASRWFRTLRHDVRSWKSFKRAFKREYLTTTDDDEVVDELRSRTQAKGEKISAYLTSLRLIMGHLKRPLSTEQQVKIAYKRLTPTYRRQVDASGMESLSKLEKNLRQYEKMRFPAAAFKGAKKDSTKGSKNVAAIEKEEGTTDQESIAEVTSGTKKAEKKTKKSKTKKSKTKKNSEEVEVEALKQTTPTPPTAPVQVPNPPTYAAVTANKENKRFQPKQAGTGTVPVGQPGTVPVGQPGTPGTPKPFVGICFICQMVGHRSTQCPQKTCFVCQQPGHFAAHCPTRAQQLESCLVCKTPGVNFLTCPTCIHVRNALGNGQWGAQNASVPPSNPPRNQ